MLRVEELDELFDQMFEEEEEEENEGGDLLRFLQNLCEGHYTAMKVNVYFLVIAQIRNGSHS